MKNFGSIEDTIKSMRRQLTAWEKVFAKDIWQLSKMYQKLLKLNDKKPTNLILKTNKKKLKQHWDKTTRLLEWPTSRVLKAPRKVHKLMKLHRSLTI